MSDDVPNRFYKIGFRDGAKQELEIILKRIETETISETGIWKARKMIKDRLKELGL